MKYFKQSVLAGWLLLALTLAACGDSTATPTAGSAPRAAAVATAAPNLASPKIINEESNDSTVQLKVGETLLAAFDPSLSWGFNLEPAGDKSGVLVPSTQGVNQPYQSKFEAQKAGTVKLTAQGSCKPEPGKLCHQAIFIYTVTVNVS